MEEAIPVLRVTEANASVSWYQHLGYEKEWEHRFAAGMPAFVSLARNGGARLFLSEHTGDARPKGLFYLRVDDLDAVAQALGVRIVEQPWGRELHLTDPDGNRLRIGPVADT